MIKKVKITEDITVYIPEIECFLRVFEGSGMNLSEEDTAAGYKDYLYISIMQYDQGGLVETDGGIKLLDQLYMDWYETTENLISEAMKFQFGRDFSRYTIIQVIERDDWKEFKAI